MTTTVINSGSIERLIELLPITPLDPVFEQYGNFVDEGIYRAKWDSDAHEFVDDKANPVYPDAQGMFRIFGNFYEVSAVFSIDTNDKELIDKLTALIEANKASDGYAAAKIEIAKSNAALADSNRRARGK